MAIAIILSDYNFETADVKGVPDPTLFEEC